MLTPALLALALVLALPGKPATAKTRAELTQERTEANPGANWWELMDTGPFLSDTFRAFGPEGDVAVLKGVALKVGPKEQHSFVFDTETLRMVAGFAGTVTLAGTPWDGKHGGNSHLPADRSSYFFVTRPGPGWAVEGDWEDPRPNGNGPLPDDRGEYHGLYRHRKGTVLSYSVGGTPVLELPTFAQGSLVRCFELGPVSRDLAFLVSDPSLDGPDQASSRKVAVHLANAPDGVRLNTRKPGRLVVQIPAGTLECAFQLLYHDEGTEPPDFQPGSLASRTHGGPALFPETIEVSGRAGESGTPFAVDSIPLPRDNPWFSEIRFGGFDFFPDGSRVACSTWNGDVWIADGIDGDLSKITWKRFASGLFQTLGLKIVDGVIYTQGRDQITRLHDLNEDGEADFYECFNNDVLITEGFHEFSFDLQTDAEGNFYFSKAMPVLRGGRGFAPWTPHNGAILKVSPDGDRLERIAWGLRAPGGLGVGPNGELTTGENEGSWVPRCKLTYSDPDGGSFHGVVPSEWDGRQFVRTLPNAPDDYEKPLCWLPYYVDNSSGSQLWVPTASSWTPHAGELLHLSYGKSAVYRVLRETVAGQIQGGVYRLPIRLTTAAMRARFHPGSGHLYLIGFRGWQTNGGTGFQRIRFTGEGSPTPLRLNAHENGLLIEFNAPLDPEIAADPRRYALSKWDYVWGPQYGSGRFSIDQRNAEARREALEAPSKGSRNQIDTVQVRAATLLSGGKTLFLYIPHLTPAMQMEVKMDLASRDGLAFRETIWNTIHNLRPAFDGHGLDLANLPEIETGPVGNPGLILSMAHGSTDDAVVVDRLALTLDPKAAATPFIDPRRGREMVFDGNLLVESRDRIAFRLEGQGWASLKIDGETLAEGDLPLESSAIELTPGPHTLFCSFRRQQNGHGRIQLLWSGQEFVWEPVRPEAFRHLPNAVVEAKETIRRGRDLFAAVGCLRCHGSRKAIQAPEAMPELLESLPDFQQIGSRVHPGWLEQWVRQPEGFCPSVAPDEAPHIAAYLASRRGATGSGPEGDASRGETLAEDLHFKPWADQLAEEAKHTATGLYRLLLSPGRHHPHTTFPDLHLAPQEAADLTAWILSRQPKARQATGGDPARGKTAVANRCLACHGTGGNHAYEYEAQPLEAMWNRDWMHHGCLSEEEGNAPELGLSLEEKQALLAFKNVDSNGGLKSLRRFVPHEYATRTLNRLQCAQCHSGENQLPEITFAGEKLRADWLGELFAGETLPVRPWLQARMPAFPGHARRLAKGVAHGAGVQTVDPLTAPDPPMAEVGERIAGPTGYACVTCHAAGGQKAVQAFEGQGPNLQISSERLRYDYYQSWMHWPQRFVPTTIMPKYTASKTKALNPTFLDGDSRAQFEALWQWMRTLEGAQTLLQESSAPAPSPGSGPAESD